MEESIETIARNHLRNEISRLNRCISELGSPTNPQSRNMLLALMSLRDFYKDKIENDGWKEVAFLNRKPRRIRSYS